MEVKLGEYIEKQIIREVKETILKNETDEFEHRIRVTIRNDMWYVTFDDKVLFQISREFPI